MNYWEHFWAFAISKPWAAHGQTWPCYHTGLLKRIWQLSEMDWSFTRRKRLLFWQFYDAINGSTRKFWHSGEVLCVLENQSIVCIGDSGENIPLLGVLTWLRLKLIKSLYHTGCTSLHCSGSAKRLEKSCREIFKKPSWCSQGTHQDICISSTSQGTYCSPVVCIIIFAWTIFCRDKGLCENKMGWSTKRSNWIPTQQEILWILHSTEKWELELCNHCIWSPTPCCSASQNNMLRVFGDQ